MEEVRAYRLKKYPENPDSEVVQKWLNQGYSLDVAREAATRGDHPATVSTYADGRVYRHWARGEAPWWNPRHWEPINNNEEMEEANELVDDVEG